MTAPRIGPLLALVNARAGSADKAREALADTRTFAIRAVEPDALVATLEAAVAEGTPRVLVAGGDGTLATAAGVLAGTETALAVLPGGTLNHFARDLGIPTDAAEAVQLAVAGRAAPVDVGYVNDRLFLNTSSIGAYVRFVRLRDAFEGRVGYRVASLAAAVRVLFALRTYRVTLSVDGREHTYRTPVVFIGVGERELRVPMLGGRVAEGRRGLHVLVVRGGPVRQLVGTAVLALVRGLQPAARTRWLDSFMVEECRIERAQRGLAVSVDGEVVELDAPLRYRLSRDALAVIQPDPARAATPGSGSRSGSG
jgi:diacylglycerol kinase family enzyme